MIRQLLSVSLAVLWSSTSALAIGTSCEDPGAVANPFPEPDAIAPDMYHVVFNTTVTLEGGVRAPAIILEVTRKWAPYGADRFYSLVADNYYNDAAFFKVNPGVAVQWGIAADPNVTAKWDTTFPDDPVEMSNTKWTVSFASSGEHSRTTQVFINLDDHSEFDDQGFAPFAVVISGFETVEALVNPTPGDPTGVDQTMYYTGGNEWLLEQYPNISMIVCEGEAEYFEETSDTAGGENLDYMLVYSFVSLSVVIAAVAMLFYCRRSCNKTAYDGSDHVALMDYSASSVNEA